MTRRRQVIRALGAVIGVGLPTGMAGCMGDDSLRETQDALDQMGVHLEEAGQKFAELQQHLDSEDWESCLSSVDPVREDLTAAQEAGAEAQQLAEEGGHDQRADAATRGLELIDILGEMVDEVEGLCEAASNGDTEEANQRLASLKDLEQQRQQKQQELEDAFGELEE